MQQQPADLNLAATQQRPLGWPPVPQQRQASSRPVRPGQSGERVETEKIARPWTEERFGELLKQVPNNRSGAIWPLQRRGMTNSQIAALCDMQASSVPGYRKGNEAVYDGVPGGDRMRLLLKLDTLRQVERDFLIQTTA